MKQWIRLAAGQNLQVALALLLLSAAPADAQSDPPSLRLDARALFDRAVFDQVQLAADGDAVELLRGELIEDDGPASGYSYQPNEERLSATVWAKKILALNDARCEAATLLIAPGGELKLHINGQPAALTKHDGLVGKYWEAYTLDPRHLRTGANELVFSGTGRLWIARDDEYAAGAPPGQEPPNRSARSIDAGRTWSDRNLGAAGDVDGEYYVRLYLDRYRAEGAIMLPVVDLGNLGGAPVGPRLEQLQPVQLTIAGKFSPGAVSIRWRSGPTPLLREAVWGTWLPCQAGAPRTIDAAGRYLQLQVRLRTDDPQHSPRVEAVALAATALPGSEKPAWRVVEEQNPPLRQPCVEFAYEPYHHPRLKQLRQAQRLDEVVRGATSEWDLVRRLAVWASQRWKQGHLGEVYPPWDALEILKPHTDGSPVGGFCQQYNVVFLQACESFGIPGRAISLGPGPRDGQLRGGNHEVVEIWSNDFAKWVYLDGNAAWYAVDRQTQVPLSLLELRDRQLRTLDGQDVAATDIVRLAETRYQWNGLAGWPPFVELRLIPRSDFLQRAAPLPLNQGMRGCFWTGHFVWTDSRAPAAKLYRHLVTQPAAWEWSVNRVHLWLEQTEQPNTLRVHVEGAVPGLETYLARFDEAPPKKVSAQFTWTLHSGRNRLEVFGRNTAQRNGVASWTVLEVP